MNDNQSKIFESIAHDTRVKILRMVNKKPLTFTELKKKLNIQSSGNITHHLNKLEGLVELNETRDYVITKRGKEALFALDAVNKTNKRTLFITYILLSGFIFYSVWITVSYYINPFKWFEPLIGLGITIIFVFIITLLTRKRYSKEDWNFLWGPQYRRNRQVKDD